MTRAPTSTSPEWRRRSNANAWGGTTHTSGGSAFSTTRRRRRSAPTRVSGCAQGSRRRRRSRSRTSGSCSSTRTRSRRLPLAKSWRSCGGCWVAELTLVEAVNDAFHVELERDDSVLVMGEDVGRAGGVFRATAGLRDRYGPDRCVDTPLAEAGILG